MLLASQLTCHRRQGSHCCQAHINEQRQLEGKDVVDARLVITGGSTSFEASCSVLAPKTEPAMQYWKTKSNLWTEIWWKESALGMGRGPLPSPHFSPQVKQGKRQFAARSRNSRLLVVALNLVSQQQKGLGEKKDVNLLPCCDLRRPLGLTEGKREHEYLCKKSSLPC